MTQTLAVYSGQPNFESLVEEYAQRCDEHYLVLDVGQTAEVGSTVVFNVYLEDGTVAFQGSGECAEASMHDESVDEAYRHRVILTALALDNENRAVFNRFLEAAGIAVPEVVRPASEAPMMIGDEAELIASDLPPAASDAPMAADDFATSMVPVPDEAPAARISVPAAALPEESTSLVAGDWDDSADAATTAGFLDQEVPAVRAVSAPPVSASVPPEREPSLPPALPSNRVSSSPGSVSAAPSAPPADAGALVSLWPPSSPSVPPSAPSAPPAMPSAPPVVASAPPVVSSGRPTIESDPIAFSIPPASVPPLAADAEEIESLSSPPEYEDVPLSVPPRGHISVAPMPPRPATGLRRPTLQATWRPLAELPLSTGASSGYFAYSADVLPAQASAPRPRTQVTRVLPASALARLNATDDQATSEIDISSL